MQWYFWVIIALLAVILLVIAPLTVSAFFAFNFIFPRPKGEGDFGEMDLSGTEYSPYSDKIKASINFFKGLPHELLEITSFDGLKLVGKYYDNGSKKTVIFAHGYTAPALNNFAVVGEDLWNEGYNIFMLDERAHNGSEGDFTTFGIKERKDVVEWTHYINDRYAPESIVLYGMSMGCASVEMSLELELPKTVKCAVLDCGFKSVVGVMTHQTQKVIKVPAGFSVWVMSLIAKKRADFDMNEASPEKALKNTDIPCFFIHGELDETVPLSHAIANFEACNAQKERFFVPNAGHATAYYYGEEEIKNSLVGFLGKYIA